MTTAMTSMCLSVSCISRPETNVKTLCRRRSGCGAVLVPVSYKQKRIICMAPEEEKMTRRSPLDFPIEWERPKPGRRPDIFPQFSPMKTPLPPPLPADPPEEEEEEEEKKEEEEDPEKKNRKTPKRIRVFP